MTLRTRLFLSAAPILLLFAAYNSTHLLHREKDQLLGELHARATAMASLLASNSAYAMQTLNDTLLQSNVNSAFLQDDVTFVRIEDATGRVLADGDPSLVGDVAPPSAQDPTTMRVDVPIDMRGRTLGVVHLGLSTLQTQDAIRAAQRQVLFTSLLLTLVVAVLTGVAAHRLTLPLTVVARTADRMAEGHLAARVPVRPARMQPGSPFAWQPAGGVAGDLLPLALNFNRMAERLEGRVRGERDAHIQLTQRVSQLLDFTEGVAGGALDTPPPASKDDELGRLADDFTSLLARLRERVDKEQSFRAALEKSAHELQEAHARLSLADRQKTDFLVVVSHELRTPLTAIKAFAELLLDGVDERETRVEFLAIIQREADRLTRLINNLLDLSRIDAGRMNWRQDRISISRLTRQAADLAAPMAQEKGVRIDVLVADDRELEGDAERLSQALFEVIGNAVNASESGGAVRVYVADTPAAAAAETDVHTRVGLVVEDRGCGLDEAHHVAIFERFWQVTRPTVGRELERPRGSGLGLPLAKAIVTAHSGTITLSSIHPAEGGGTRFMLTLPLRRKELRVQNLLAYAEPYLGRMVESSRWRELLNKLLEPNNG